MTSDAHRLATHTHLDHETAEQLLATRTLSGDPAEHDYLAILLTEDEVVVETRTAFEGRARAPSAIELALTCGTTVEQMRRDSEAAASFLDADDADSD